MNRLRVGVMRGGKGSEYSVSLKSGAAILSALDSEKYETHDIIVTSEGEWNIDGVPIAPANLSQRIDVVFNALHGEYGEDGKVQRMLELFCIPYTGSTPISSAIGMNKELAKKYFEAIGIKVPKGVVVARGEEVSDVVERIGNEIKAPYVVKPLSGGSSIGLSLARNESELISGIETALAYSERAIIEEYIKGREVTLGVLDSIDGTNAYVTPALEILLVDGTLFDYEQKYNNPGHPIGPARMTDDEKKILEETALLAHLHLGARHYARYDFILTENGPVILEVNTLPGLTHTSLLPRALSLSGLGLTDFADYVITLAIQRK